MLRHIRRRLKIGAIGSVALPFSGTYLDTANGDVMADRLAVPSDAALTVSPGSVAFANTGADKALDMFLKDTDGNHIWTALDHWKLEANYTVTSFIAGQDKTGFFTGGLREVNAAAGLTTFFATETKTFATLSGRIMRRLNLNSGASVGGAVAFDMAGLATTVAVTVERQGNTFTATQVFTRPGIAPQTETLTRAAMTSGHPSVDSFERPRLFLRPFVRFISGTHSLNSVKFSQSFPNAKYAFMGDSLTDSRFTTNYAEGYAQLIRGDHPGEVMVSGAPSATVTEWLGGTYSFLRMKPKKVFILLGTNDIGALGVGGKTMASTQADYTTLVNRVIAAGATPVCLTVPPNGNFNTPTFNTWLRAQPWEIIDLWPLLVGTGNAANAAYLASGDAVHFNTAGNLVVANAVRAWISANPG